MGENHTYRIVNVWVASTENGNGADLQEIERLADEVEEIGIGTPAAIQLAKELRDGIFEAREKAQKAKAEKRLSEAVVSC